MKNTAIIIPSRLEAKRFPNKPLAEINNLPMIIHVLNRAKESKVGEVFVATPDEEISKVVENHGGNAILTKQNHASGSDRVHEAYLRILKNKIDFIINLQGDMPNISPSSISKLEKLMKESDCDIGTLGAKIKKKNEISNPNVVKVQTNQFLKNNDFLEINDFFRIKKDLVSKKIYHHCGIYIFKKESLKKYVNIPRSKLEIERNLEQMRAVENKMKIKVGLSDTAPLSVDTKEDLKEIIKEMNKL